MFHCGEFDPLRLHNRVKITDIMALLSCKLNMPASNRMGNIDLGKLDQTAIALFFRIRIPSNRRAAGKRALYMRQLGDLVSKRPVV